MSVRTAEGSLPIIGIHAALTLLGFQLHLGLGGVNLALLAFSLYFFRDPEREVPAASADVLFSSADGKVLSIQEVYEDSFLEGPALRISIFMSIFDAHVNRAPADGEVHLVSRKGGGFRAAFRDDAAEENERIDLGLMVAGHRVLARQVAGLVARRIVCRARVGERLRRGERYGLIRYGSRLDLFLPHGSTATVAPGEQVYAGLTPLARLPSEAAS